MNQPRPALTVITPQHSDWCTTWDPRTGRWLVTRQGLPVAAAPTAREACMEGVIRAHRERRRVTPPILAAAPAIAAIWTRAYGTSAAWTN